MVAYYFITGTGWLFLGLLAAAVCGFLGALAAERNGGSPWLGGGLGFFLGPIGVLLAAVLPGEPQAPSVARWAMPPAQPPLSTAPVGTSPESTFRACPDCAEKIQTAAKICRFCGYDFIEGRRGSKS